MLEPLEPPELEPVFEPPVLEPPDPPEPDASDEAYRQYRRAYEQSLDEAYADWRTQRKDQKAKD